MTGFVISEPSTARGVLEPLMNVFGVHGFEQAGRFVFRSIGRAASAIDVAHILVESSDGDALSFVLEDQGDLPCVAELYCNDPLRDFQVVGASVRRDTGQGTESLSISGSMEMGQATALAESWMARRYAERRTASFSLPWSGAALHVGDRVRLDALGGGRNYVVSSLEDGEVRTIKAVALAPNIVFGDDGETPRLPPGTPVSDMKPLFHLIDLPLWPSAEDPAGQLRVACHAKPWRGVVTCASPSEDGFVERGLIGERAVMGELTTPLKGAPSGRLINHGVIELVLYSGELGSRSLAQILNGANTAVLKSPDGRWEVLQFLEAEEIGQNRWRLTRILRGQLGTEISSLSEKAVGTPFVLLDGGVQSIGLQSSEIGLELNWRIGAAGKSFSDEFFDTVKAAGGLQALRPLSPVHLKSKRLGNGDLSVHWVRRGRLDADSWMGEDIPLGEEREAYQVEVWQSDTLVRSVRVQTASWIYPNTELLAELGTTDFQIRVAMLSAKTGMGDFTVLDMSNVL